MIEQLRDYYDINGILSTNFNCKYKSTCSENCSEFTGPKSAYVGLGYENGHYPRLLFLSLDSGSGDKNDKNRLPESVRQKEESTNVMALHKHKHWYRTYEIAWYILKRFNSDIAVSEIKGNFAHANSAKCCMNKPQRKKADKILFKNCVIYLKSELEILNPRIVVTQGNEAKKAILVSLDERIKKMDDFSSLIKLNGKEVFWLHTYHPNCWGSFNKLRNFNKETQICEGWERYAESIFNFVNEKAN